MSALHELPAFEGCVYQGVPSSALGVIQNQYKRGMDIQWSSFTSTSCCIETVKGFAERRGIVFVIDVVNGQDITYYSAYQGEGEILLSPNSRFLVTSEATLNEDGFYYVQLHQRSGEELVF